MKRSFTLLCGLFCAALFAQTSWTPISSGTQTTLNCISFGTDQVGYIGGNDSTLLKTTDGGKTWQRIALNVTQNIGWKFVTDLQFFDANNGYALINNGIFSTTDGGATWQPEDPNATNMCFKEALYFFDQQNGFVGGAMCFQGATLGTKTNGIWDTVEVIGTPFGNEIITAFDFLNAQVGIAASSEKYFFRTVDGGALWDTIPNGLFSLGISDVLFMNDTLVYATFETPGMEGVVVSYDGGLSWKRFDDIATFAYPGLSVAVKTKTNKPFFGGDLPWNAGGIIFEQIGEYWPYAIVPQPIHGMATHSDSVTFAVGDSGYIAVNVLPQQIGMAHEEINHVQVYPNPASAQLIVEMPQNGNEKEVIIYNAIGITVYQSVILNQKEMIETAHWPNGVYVMQIGNWSQKVIVQH